MASIESGNVTSAGSLATRPWWQLGLAAGVIAAVINVVLHLLYQAVAGAPLQVTQPGGGPVEDLEVVMVVILSVLPALLGTLLAIALDRWTRSAPRWFVTISVIAALLSLASPLALPEVATGNKLTLAVMHLVVAAVTIAALLPRLSARR